MALPPEKTKRLRYDGIETYLGVQLDPFDSSIDITFTGPLLHDGGIQVPTLADDEYLTLSILSPNYVLKEIVYLISYDSGDPTHGVITRREEGTQLATHSAGVKIVHSPTVLDFSELATHLADDHAHWSVINGVVDGAIQVHVDDPNPHPQYVLAGDSITIGNGDTLTVQSGGSIILESGAVLWAKNGSIIKAEGDLFVQNGGKFFIDGKRIIVSNTAPTTPAANTVWIQTFG